MDKVEMKIKVTEGSWTREANHPSIKACVYLDKDATTKRMESKLDRLLIEAIWEVFDAMINDQTGFGQDVSMPASDESIFTSIRAIISGAINFQQRIYIEHCTGKGFNEFLRRWREESIRRWNEEHGVSS